jgi:REP element-mobilizing transposase RayT
VTIRGLERRAIFRDTRDRQAFLDRLESIAQDTGLGVLAWALMPNHAHLLVRTPRPRPPARGGLAGAMRRLLTSHAVAFNRRHSRSGHLFQNRYKSIVVEEEPYLLELVRYIHLNPLRAGLVRDLPALDAYPWSGHSALMAKKARPWQALDEVLGLFGRRVGEARRRYRAFLADGVARGRRPDLQGGGLRRSAGGWVGVASLKRGRERWAADERILGSGAFVEALRAEAARDQAPWPRPRAATSLRPLIELVAALWNLSPAALTGGTRRQPVPAARAAACALAVTHMGLPAAVVAEALAVSLPAVCQAIPRGHALLSARKVEPQALLRSLKANLT